MLVRASLLGLVAVAGALVCVGCGDDETGTGGATSSSSSTAGPGTTASTGDATSSSSTGGPITTDFVAGGDRPVDVEVPSSYDPATPTPLLILLHGYTANGDLQNMYFGMSAVAEARGLLYAHPDGTVDAAGDRFWNATDACCDFYGSGVDDVAYLLGLVDEISSKVNVDPKRVYFLGHSNGGFMSYRLACEASDRIAAIASLAGASFADPTDCGATSPLSVLQIHGTMDEVVAYEGGTFAAAYPSAAESTAHFAALAGCAEPPVSGGAPIDADAGLAGEETTVETYPDCDAGYAVELWTIVGGSHVPALAPRFSAKVVDFLLAHPKP
jgi:polyhydroxybutyrate depolymerase